MIQEVIVKANAHEALRPLVQAAIRNQLKILQQGIDHSRERIAEFEKTTGMSSAEFEQKLLGRELEDTLDVLDWNMELASMRLLERQYKYLDEAEVR
jgi:hypothetical protein